MEFDCDCLEVQLKVVQFVWLELSTHTKGGDLWASSLACLVWREMGEKEESSLKSVNSQTLKMEPVPLSKGITLTTDR